MPQRYEEMTLEEHVELGEQLKGFSRGLAHRLNSFPAKSPQYQALRRAEKALLTLRSVMDSEVCRRIPMGSPLEQRWEPTRFYFGDLHPDKLDPRPLRR
jgi:hypothetical protein